MLYSNYDASHRWDVFTLTPTVKSNSLAKSYKLNQGLGARKVLISSMKAITETRSPLLNAFRIGHFRVFLFVCLFCSLRHNCDVTNVI